MVSVLRRETISHPSIITSDLPTLTLPTFFRKLAQNVHFRKADSQCGKASRQNPMSAAVRKKTFLVPRPSLSPKIVSSVLFPLIPGGGVPISTENENVWVALV